jgi:hypothetical protein
VKAFLEEVHAAGFRGPVLLQCYAIKGDREDNLRRSMTAWKAMSR